MNLAVIPARAGSKRIPLKNIREFCGRPMMAWAIEAALDSGCFDHVIVSTDDAAIAGIAKEAGATCPFLRPAHLSDDQTATRPVIAQAIEAMEERGISPRYVCCLYATAAFTGAESIRQAYEKLIETDATYVFPVLPFPAPIERAMRRQSDGHVSMIAPEHFLTRSQDLEDAWHDAGQLYWAAASTWQTDAPIFGPNARTIALDRNQAFDIDTESDWALAEAHFKAHRNLA